MRNGNSCSRMRPPNATGRRTAVDNPPRGKRYHDFRCGVGRIIERPASPDKGSNTLTINSRRLARIRGISPTPHWLAADFLATEPTVCFRLSHRPANRPHPLAIPRNVSANSRAIVCAEHNGLDTNGAKRVPWECCERDRTPGLPVNRCPISILTGGAAAIRPARQETRRGRGRSPSRDIRRAPRPLGSSQQTASPRRAGRASRS